MYAKGHFGLTLILGSLVMLPFGSDENKLLIIFLAAGLSTLPDIDLEWQKRGLPIHHRGPTHSILFSIIVGVLLGGLLYYSNNSVTWFLMGFLSGNLSIISHMIGDSLTFMGFKPLWPFDNKEVSYGITKANNRFVNDGFMTLGVIAFILYYLQTQGKLGSILSSFL